jgi:O-antigen/teichoic acid export membrane protein
VATDSIGACLFGVVIGWVTYRTLRRSNEAVSLSDIATVIGAVGGAAVTGLFTNSHLFSWYCIGLAIGFFSYLVIAVRFLKDVRWLSRD